VSDTYYYNNLI